MNKYELAVIISSRVEEDEKAATLEKIKALIERFGGVVTNVNDWGKKRLAYEIQKMKEGYYFFIEFEGDSKCPNEIEQRIRIKDHVIRYLCIRQDA